MQITMAGEKYEVKYTEDPNEISSAISVDMPKYTTYDTETTGLHIKKDHPFLAAVAWDGKVYVFPPTKEMFRGLYQWSKMVKRVYAHNTSFDMHAMANICGDAAPLTIKNWGDTMGLCRLSFESISVRDGGDSLALKRIAKKYIDETADRYEKQVKAWLKAKEAADRKILIALLHGIKDDKGKWSMKRLTDSLNNETTPQEVMEVFEAWKMEYPKPTYQDVPLEIMIPYLATDVILTNILVRKALPIVVRKEQVEVMNREFDLIPVVWKMERAGIQVDRDYLQESNKKLEDYIQDLTIKMHELAGIEFSVGQHQKIKGIYTDILGAEPESTDKKFLKKMQKSEDEVGAELATLINKLRTLEKWKSTYIERILEVSEYDGRFYSQMNQFNPVSGRFSGDAQQFPKKALYDLEGNELFHPRRAFIGRMYYLDYSQVELRMQGHYTIPFGGDLNLCRAYMPFACRHFRTGELYDYKTVEGRSRWNEKNGEVSAWLMEDGTPWTPTDVHSATTIKALGKMGINYEDLDEKTFASWRSVGKTFNFMRNYGGGPQMAAQVLEIDFDEAKAMAEGYTEAFPLVITYQDKISQAMQAKGFVQNLRGRRYYVDNYRKFYKCGNYIIQGSSAEILKDCMVQIDKFLVKNNCKTRLILCVHDELQFEVPVEEDWVIPHIKRIMEDVPDVMVPIIADVELTETTWAEKFEVHV